jgi:PKD repeat protein
MGKVLGLGGTLVATVLLGSACTVHQTVEPALAGPSELAQSVSVTVSRDTIKLGPSATSAGESAVVTVRVRDQNGNPVSGKSVRLDALVGQLVSNCGTLSQHDLQTGSDGTATAVFTAPGQPMPLPECQNFTIGDTVTLAAAVVGTGFQTTLPQAATIRLIAPSIISPPSAIAVNFMISPNPAPVNSQVTFSDAGSTSPGHTIVSYRWDFSDGVTKFGTMVQHDFNATGTFTATLTVTDDIGQQSFKSANVVIN